MRLLILDDDQMRHASFAERLAAHDVDHVDSAAEAIRAMQSRPYDVVLLDHDLAPGDGSGSDVVRWMEGAHWHRRPAVLVHSLNPYHAPRMVRALEHAGYTVTREPFDTHDMPNVARWSRLHG